MPHLHIEYTDNLTGLNERELMREINAVVCAHPTVTDEADVKARIARLSSFYIGNQPDNRGFVHVQLQLMAGRSEQAKGRDGANYSLAQKNIHRSSSYYWS